MSFNASLNSKDTEVIIALSLPDLLLGVRPFIILTAYQKQFLPCSNSI